MLKIYDPDQITVVFAGILIAGYADGEFVRIAQEVDNFSDVGGTDGEVSRSRSKDRRGTITFVLMQTSSVNAQLSAVANRDLLEDNGAGVAETTVRDRQGGSLYFAAESWISRPPDASFDRTATSREWTIRCAKLERNDAGN